MLSSNNTMLTKNRSAVAFFSSVSLLVLASAFAAGCTTETTTGDGTPPPGGDGGTCSATGTGTVSVVVTGLPADVPAKVTLTGPSGASDVTASRTIADAAAGSYTASAERVASVDPIVRTLFEPKVSTSSFCLEGTKTQTVDITYTAIGSSNKLWSTNANSDAGSFLGFASANLGATGSPAASVAIKGGSGKGLAFDKDGNLWTLAGTTADAPLSRYAAADLGASGTRTPDRTIVPTLTGCGPSLVSIAFDPSGALWAADMCADRLVRFSPETLSASRPELTLAADDIATGTLEAPRGIAFDKEGNMWVSDATTLHFYPASSLAPGQPHVPSFGIKAKTEGDAELPPDALAFDKDGNLWVTNFGGNAVFKLTPADLAVSTTTKELVPSTILTIGVGALLESLAFDEGGGLWITFSQGKVARIAPAQLGTSTGPGMPTVPQTVVTSADLGYSAALAFFPAPASLPLYSRF